MKILNNYLENEVINKGLILKASDWILVPCHKVFNGKKIQAIVNKNGITNFQEIPAKAPIGFKKVLWTVLAVSTIPLATIAAFFKLIISPSIGTSKKPFKIGGRNLLNNLEEVANALKPLKEAGLSGRVIVYLALTPEQQNLTNAQAANSIIENIEKARLAVAASSVAVNTHASSKINKFACLNFTIMR